MSLTVVASAKGSPGATSTALRLAVELGRRLGSSYPACCLVDTDPDGGDVALLLGLSAAPSVATLALAGRHGFSESVLISHTQRSPLLPGVAVLAGVAGCGQRSAVSWLAEPLGDAARRANLPIVVDAGRVGSIETTRPLYTAADQVVVVCDSSTASIVHTRSALIALGAEGIDAAAVLAGEAREPDAELAAALGRPLLARVPSAALPAPFAPRVRHRGSEAKRATLLSEGTGVERLARVLCGEAAVLADPLEKIVEHAPVSLEGAIADLNSPRRR